MAFVHAFQIRIKLSLVLGMPNPVKQIPIGSDIHRYEFKYAGIG